MKILILMLLKTLTLKEPLQRFAVKSLKGQKRTLKHYKQTMSLFQILHLLIPMTFNVIHI